MMKALSLLPTACLLVFLVFLGVSAGGQDQNTQPEVKPKIVAMQSLSYDPKKLEIRVGGSVVWNNKAFAAHTATSDDDGKTFDTGNVEPGKSSKPVRFEKAGEFKYHCLVHGKTMSGTIVVKTAEK